MLSDCKNPNHMIPDRNKALEKLHEHVKNEKTIVHCLASEAVMRALARRLGEDEERWGLTGLLHDIDVEVTGADPKVHALKAEELLQDFSLDEEMIDAIRMHNDEATGLSVPPNSSMHWLPGRPSRV